MGNVTSDKSKARYIHDLWIFEDYAEFIDTVKQPHREQARIDEQIVANGYVHQSSLKHRDDGWAGTDTWNEAIELADNGWQQGIEQFSEQLELVAPYVIAALGEPSQDLAPAGYLPHVPSYCSGSPANMWTEGDTFSARTPVLRMLVSCSALANVEAEQRMRRGAAICAVIDYFENLNIRVEITACMLAQGTGDYRRQGNKNRTYAKALHECYIPIKRASEALDMDRVAFALANPAFHRRFGFWLREQNEDLYNVMDMGSSTDAQPEPDQIYFPCLHTGHGYDDDASALRKILGHVMEQLDDNLKQKVGQDWEFILDPDSRAVV